MSLKGLLIGTAADYKGVRQLIKDDYGSVIVFKSKEDAVMCGATEVFRLERARLPRKKRLKSDKPPYPLNTGEGLHKETN